MHHTYQSGSFWFLFICLSLEQIRFLQNTLRPCHKVLSGGRPAPTAGLLVSRPERFPSQSGMRAAGSLESGGRMWEISWNVGFFLFPPRRCYTSAGGPSLVFVPSAFCAAAPRSNFKKQAEEHSGGIQSPQDCENALPQFLNVIMS